MKKNYKVAVTSVAILLSLTTAIGMNVSYVLATSSKPGSSSSSSSASYSGAVTFASDASESGKTYNSTKASQNTILASGGKTTLDGATITKSGDSSDENADFYGTNAAVLAYNGATLNLNGGNVTTAGSHANGIFAYGTGIINATGTTIKTSKNNSGGVMVTGGGTLNATNLTVETEGGSSAPIRSDRGGGTLTVSGGTYTAHGQGSPAIYSTANISTDKAELVSTSAEGAVIEGANSITLESTKLTDTNTTLNGNSETYKNVFIYQSMSGDASEGSGTFTAKNSTIATNKGDTFFITNTQAVINLTNNSIINNDTSGSFLRAQSGKWGNSGSNGGKVQLTAKKQGIVGDIVLDNISTLTASLTDNSYYKGTINNRNKAKSIALSISSNTNVVLTGDSYITSLNNEDSSNNNIYGNGYKLYVNSKEVTTNSGVAPDYDGSSAGTTNNTTTDDSNTTTESVSTESKSTDNTFIYILCGAIGACAVLAIAVTIILIKKKKSKDNLNKQIAEQTKLPDLSQPNTHQ